LSPSSLLLTLGLAPNWSHTSVIIWFRMVLSCTEQLTLVRCR